MTSYSFRGSVHFHHSGEHSNLYAVVVLELRVLPLDSEATEGLLTVTLSKAWVKKPKACLKSHTRPVTRPHLPVVQLPLGALSFKQQHSTPWPTKNYSHFIMQRNHLVQLSKFPWHITVSAMFKSSKFKVYSEIHNLS